MLKTVRAAVFLIALIFQTFAFAQLGPAVPTCPGEWTNDSTKVEKLFQTVLGLKGVFSKVAIEDQPTGFTTKEIHLINSGGRTHVHVSAGIDVTRPAQVCKVKNANQLKINFESGFVGPVTFTIGKLKPPASLKIEGPYVNSTFTAR